MVQNLRMYSKGEKGEEKKTCESRIFIKYI